MNKSTKPVAFISYSHSDNKIDGNKILELVGILQGRITLMTGKTFNLFLDRKDIKWGENWMESIRTNLDASTFLIPIVTPAYFNSSACRKEFSDFMIYENTVRRLDLIKPVYYVTSDRLEKSKLSNRESWAKEIANRQYFDFRELRLKSFESTEVIEGIEQMAIDIKNSITNSHRKVRLPITENKTKKVSSRQIVMNSSRLSKTQINILYALYNLAHPPEIPVDDFLDLVNQEQPGGINQIENTKEFFYRLKDLMNLGLLELKPLNSGLTIVSGPEKIHRILLDNNIFPSGV